jgi:hypothetical protein
MKKKAILFLVPICILLAGCGSDKKADPAVQGSSAGSGGENTPITQLPSLPSREVARGEQTAAAEQPELPLGTREKLPFRIIPSPVLPEDFFIGPLGGKDGDLPVYSVLKPLMEVLSSGGRPEKDLLISSFLEGQDFYWERFFSDFPEGDYRFRLGEANYYAPGAASVNCRFFRPLPDGKKAAAEGEFILENQEGNWKVAGLNVAREDLLNPHQIGSEPFEPQVYRWLQLY